MIIPQKGVRGLLLLPANPDRANNLNYGCFEIIADMLPETVLSGWEWGGAGETLLLFICHGVCSTLHMRHVLNGMQKRNGKQNLQQV